MKARRLKKMPSLRTDAAAERFVAKDLTEYDFSGFKPMRFEIEPTIASSQLKTFTVIGLVLLTTRGRPSAGT